MGTENETFPVSIEQIVAVIIAEVEHRCTTEHPATTRLRESLEEYYTNEQIAIQPILILIKQIKKYNFIGKPEIQANFHRLTEALEQLTDKIKQRPTELSAAKDFVDARSDINLFRDIRRIIVGILVPQYPDYFETGPEAHNHKDLLLEKIENMLDALITARRTVLYLDTLDETISHTRSLANLSSAQRQTLSRWSTLIQTERPKILSEFPISPYKSTFDTLATIDLEYRRIREINDSLNSLVAARGLFRRLGSYQINQLPELSEAFKTAQAALCNLQNCITSLYNDLFCINRDLRRHFNTYYPDKYVYTVIIDDGFQSIIITGFQLGKTIIPLETNNPKFTVRIETPTIAFAQGSSELILYPDRGLPVLFPRHSLWQIMDDGSLKKRSIVSFHRGYDSPAQSAAFNL